METECIRFDIAEGVATVTLNRPDAANAMNRALMKELMDAAILCDEDPAIRAVVLTGAGRFFCAGGDLASFAAAGDGLPALLKELTVYLHAAVSRFTRMDAPVVAAVNGTAGGGGMSLACATDVAIAAESARFTMAYTNAGLVPDGSSTFFLPRLVGERRARELMLTDRVLTAREAFEWGLVTRVVPDGDALPEAQALAAKLAQGPTAAYGATKRLLASSATQGLETQMELEARAIADAGRGHDAREGIAAFLEKRRPSFVGR
jgi:2-(1,2-epoxy-1,2-dihydrophenyl)acetyl-CoA isomerase